MSNQLQRRITARVPSLEAGGRHFPISNAKDFFVNSTAAFAADRPLPGNASTSEHRTTDARVRPTNALWLLLGWLAVSATIITAAGIVIAMYF